MSFFEDREEEEANFRRWRKAHPPKGAEFTLRGLVYRVVKESPLEMVGPSGKRRAVSADVLARMDTLPTISTQPPACEPVGQFYAGMDERG